MQPQREKTPKGGRVSMKHSVFVLNRTGKPLTPTTPAMARKLLRDGIAKKVWSKFNIFGIQLLIDSREETPDTALGVDNGTKFEGYSVVIGEENNLSVKLNLPNKKYIVKKLIERRALRHARRFRNCRRRPTRFNNRNRKGFLAPSQVVMVGSRLKVIREMFLIYPINLVAFEDIRFNHTKHRWGKNFSTIEIGKARIKGFFCSQNAQIFEYSGFETKEARERYGYRKTSIKNADKFTAHCSDSLALAVDIVAGKRIEPGLFLVVDDSYRYNRRKLHDMQPAKGGVREKYARGTVFGLRKGLLVGTPKGKTGRLSGECKGGYRYYDTEGKRQTAKKLTWFSSNFITKKIKTYFTYANSYGQ